MVFLFFFPLECFPKNGVNKKISKHPLAVDLAGALEGRDLRPLAGPGEATASGAATARDLMGWWRGGVWK